VTETSGASGPSSDRWWLIVVLLESLAVLFLLTFGNTFSGATWLHRVHLAMLGVAGLAGWTVVLLRPNRLSPLVLLAPLPVLVSLTLTSIPSGYPSLSWYAVWQCAAYIGVFWLLAMQASHRAGRRNLVVSMSIVAGFVVAVYLIECAEAWLTWLSLGFPVTSLPLRPRGAGGLIQIPTWTADVVALVTPVTVAALWTDGHRRVAAAFAVLAAATLAITGVRSVLLLVVLATVVVGVMAVRRRSDHRLGAWIAVAVAIVVIGSGLVLMTGRSFDEGRSSAYGTAVVQFVSSAVTGTGPGTYPPFRLGESVPVLSYLVFPDSHNVILTIAAESGLLGLIAAAVSLALVAVAARRALRGSGDRQIVVAASVGLAVLLGHAMVDVVFALIGVVLLAIGCLALVVTVPTETIRTGERRSWPAIAVLGTSFIFVAASAVVLTHELGRDALDSAEANLRDRPDLALAGARSATDAIPDSAPAWWVRMVAADASGDDIEARQAAERLIGLEGFGQQWIQLATLRLRSGDLDAAHIALERAVARPPADPIVELNAVAAFDAVGDTQGADAAALRLLEVQPDIESLSASGPPGLASRLAAVRQPAVAEAIATGAADTALLIALSGEDSDLADAVVAGTKDPTTRATREAIAAAWFGDRSARADYDTQVMASPTFGGITWSWRLAARACDPSAVTDWQRAAQIIGGRSLGAPASMGAAPAFGSSLLPVRYPGVGWRTGHPLHPYVAGIWSFRLGDPACVSP
jgi:hypothetical protein